MLFRSRLQRRLRPAAHSTQTGHLFEHGRRSASLVCREVYPDIITAPSLKAHISLRASRPAAECLPSSQRPSPGQKPRDGLGLLVDVSSFSLSPFLGNQVVSLLPRGCLHSRDLAVVGRGAGGSIIPTSITQTKVTYFVFKDRFITRVCACVLM